MRRQSPKTVGHSLKPMLIQASHSSPMLMNQSPMLPTDTKVPLAGDDEPRPSLPISNHPSDSNTNTTTTVDPSSMSVTALVFVFVLALFFIGFFSVFARRLIQGSDVSRPRPPPLPMNRYRPSSSFPPSSAGGLDPSAIRALPLLSYTDGGRRKAGCVVCLSEFEEEESVKVIPACGHVFHPGCIDAWLVSHGSCPICRCSEMFTPGLRGSGEVCIQMIGGGEDDSDGDSEGFGFDEQGKVGVGVGLERRIRSWSCITGGEKGTVLLRRTCSI